MTEGTLSVTLSVMHADRALPSWASAPITFFVPGIARPKERPAFGNGRTYTRPDTLAWEKTVKVHALAMRAKARWAPIKGACYAVSLDARFPTGHRRDVDNIAKAVLDALNGVLYLDDSQVGVLEIRRVLYCKSPGVYVTIAQIEEPHERR